MGSGSPVCLCSQPWHGAMELGSPQTLSSLIIIFLQVQQDPFQLLLVQQRPPAVPSLVFLWTSAPQESPQLGGLGWESQWAKGAGGGRCPFPLCLSYSYITGQLPGMSYRSKGQSKFSVALTQGCLMLVMLQTRRL